ncbi:MAG: redoxin family protein [Planctomycetes bacterium]|nr:redoxin family protein [Planctomycetota bacterium]
MRTRRSFAVLTLALGLACCATDRSGEPSIELRDLDGRLVDAARPDATQFVLLVFLGTGCPIARAYSPELASIAADYSGRVTTRLVFVDLDLDADAARRHAGEFRLPRPILLDPDHRLVHALGATTTPEAVVLDRAGRVVYSGRIDDRFAELGKPRRAAARHDLRDALDALLAGRTPRAIRTEPIGCIIE